MIDLLVALPPIVDRLYTWYSVQHGISFLSPDEFTEGHCVCLNQSCLLADVKRCNTIILEGQCSQQQAVCRDWRVLELFRIHACHANDYCKYVGVEPRSTQNLLVRRHTSHRTGDSGSRVSWEYIHNCTARLWVMYLRMSTEDTDVTCNAQRHLPAREDSFFRSINDDYRLR